MEKQVFTYCNYLTPNQYTNEQKHELFDCLDVRKIEQHKL